MVDTLSSPQSSGLEIEMDDRGSSSRGQSRQRLLYPPVESDRRCLAGVARHTLGLILLLCVVFLWTMCNFLGSVCTNLLLRARTTLTCEDTEHICG